MSKQKAKFELFSRLRDLGFTYEEAFALRRIEMTLHRWAEAECNGEIERDEKTGKTYGVRMLNFSSTPFGRDRMKWPIADRETGALRRLKAIVEAHNVRLETGSAEIIPYHQPDPRGCALYLLKRSDLDARPIDQVYNRGLAVCA